MAGPEAGERALTLLRQLLVARELRMSGHFDVGHYLLHAPDVAASGVDPVLHYVRFGAAEHRNPSAAFDTRYYLEQNPDVRASGMNPLLHFVRHGAGEGRRPSRRQ